MESFNFDEPDSIDEDDLVGDQSDIPTETENNGGDVDEDDVGEGSVIIGDDADEVLDGEQN